MKCLKYLGERRAVDSPDPNEPTTQDDDDGRAEEHEEEDLDAGVGEGERPWLVEGPLRVT